MKGLGEIQWIFNKTDNIPDMVKLKDNVLQALKNADGSPVDELGDIINNSDFQTKLKKWLNAKDDVSGKEFIDWLGKNENFDKIFEIVE